MARRECRELRPRKAAGGRGDAPTQVREMVLELHRIGSAGPGTGLQEHNSRAGASLDVPQGLPWALVPFGHTTLHPRDRGLALLRQA